MLRLKNIEKTLSNSKQFRKVQDLAFRSFPDEPVTL